MMSRIPIVVGLAIAPITTGILASVVLSLILWLLSHRGIAPLSRGQ
jgi:hypothetical protein